MKNKKQDLYPHVCKQYGKILHVFEPIFMLNYYMLIGISEEELVEEINKKMNPKDKFEVEGKDGRFTVIRIGKTEIGIIWAKGTPELIHECFHATSWAMEKKGLKLTEESDECYAYYQEFLYKCALLYNGGKKK